jgi:hypothetical protein
VSSRIARAIERNPVSKKKKTKKKERKKKIALTLRTLLAAREGQTNNAGFSENSIYTLPT